MTMQPRQTQTTTPLQETAANTGFGPLWDQYRHIIVPLLLMLLTFVVFLSAIGHDFLVGWDDDFYITQNPQVTDFSLGKVIDHWTTFRRGEYIPVTLTSYSIQHLVFGDSATGYRLINILLHGFNGILIYLCLSLLQPRQMVAIFAAVVFLIHPVQVESVVWVSQHKTVLSAFFFLSSFWLHLYASRKKGRRGALIASYILFALSILAKPAAVLGGGLFIVVNLVWLRWPTAQVIVRNLPYLVTGGVGALLVILAQNDNGGLAETGTENVLEQAQFVLHAVWDYIASLLLPFNLNNLYIYDIDKLGLTDFRMWLGIIFIGGMVVLALLQPLGKKITLFAVLWFWLLLLPLLNIIPQGFPRADRFLYLSGFMIFVLIGLAAAKMADWTKRPEAQYATMGGLALICLFLGVLTLGRSQAWENTGTLMRDHLEDYPQSVTGLTKLASYELSQGNLEAAIPPTETLVNTYPTYVEGLDLGALLVMQQGDYRTAIDLYARILALRPDDTTTKARLGVALVQLGLQAFEAGNYDVALQFYVEALNYVSDAESAPIHNNIGFTYYTIAQSDPALANNYQAALVAYNEAVKRDPNYVKAWLNIGDAALNITNYELARNAYARSVELEATFNAQNASNFCLALGELGESAEVAVEFCNIALQLEPNNGLYLGRTAHVLLLFGANQEALTIAERAVNANANLVLNWRVYGDALRLTGNPDGARQAYQQALALNPANEGALAGLQALDQAAAPAPEATPGQ